MKYSLDWLREFVELPPGWGVPEISPRLLALGFEVSGTTRLGPDFEGVVAAEVLEVRPHPNADRLRLVEVTDGRDRLTIVCGASNVARGQRVPLARVGARLPGGRRIERARIRGQESAGMLCSGKELGTGEDGEGILVLDPGTSVGADVGGLFGPPDTVLEVEVTPNRPDVLSHLGLARELAWALGARLKRAEPGPVPGSGEPLPVEVLDPEACPRYLGRSLNGLKAGSSPAWLARRLTACGLRPINALVDVTNYVLLELGQPLHAFDADLLEGERVVVRRARHGERILALDDREYVLDQEDLVIADASRPVALAGVIGGKNTAVRDQTARAFLECAYFKPSVVRHTARRLRVRTDSSIRFERGTDFEGAALASQRAAELILKLCGGTASAGSDQARPRSPVRIQVALEGIEGALGMKVSREEAERALRGLDPLLRPSPGGWELEAPSHRVDLAIEADLAEEVARHLGYDRIPEEPAPVRLVLSPQPAVQSWASALRARAVGLGFSEAFTYDFLSKGDLDSTRLQEGPRLANPVSEDWVFLRPSLLPGLLRSARRNLHHGSPSVRLFELGKVCAEKARPEDSPYPMDESFILAGILCGPDPSNWALAPREPDLPALKGVVEGLLDRLVLFKFCEERMQAFFNPRGGLQVRLDGKDGPGIGSLGQVHPALAQAWDLGEAWYFELGLDRLPGEPRWAQKVGGYSIFPSASRDLSVILDAAVAWARVESAVRGAVREGLQGLALIDVFTGGPVPAGKRSLTLRLTLGSTEKTLTDADIQACMDAALTALKGLGGVLRG